MNNLTKINTIKDEIKTTTYKEYENNNVSTNIDSYNYIETLMGTPTQSVYINSKFNMDSLLVSSDSTIPSNYQKTFNDYIWNQSNIISPSEVISDLNRLEAKYGIKTVDFNRAYKYDDWGILTNIKPEDITKWLKLIKYRGQTI